jgi:hypothetical protein
MKDIDKLIQTCIRPAAECATVLLSDINRGYTIDLAINANDDFLHKLQALIDLIDDDKLSPIIISEMISRAIRPFISQYDYIISKQMVYSYVKLTCLIKS